MKITEWNYLKMFIIWFRDLPDMVQKISIFIPLLALAGTSWIQVSDLPLIVWYFLFFLLGIVGIIVIAGLWFMAEGIVKELKKWKITN